MKGIDLPRRPPLPAKVRRIHLTAIGGVGMGSLAGLLQAAGYEVSGSDEKIYPPMSDVLRELGIPVREGYRAENIAERPDLVVIGNKVSRGNPEVQAVLDGGLPYLSFPETLRRFFLQGRRSVVVAGTHGKTTSTAMLAWILFCAGRDPSFLVGGRSLDFGGTFRLGGGPEFVVEGDEYDSAFFDKGPKFLHYDPGALLLTAVEFDHADIYADVAAVEGAFARLLDIVPADAPVVASADFPRVAGLLARCGRSCESFGLSPAAGWRATGIETVAGRTRFGVCRRGEVEARLDILPPGPINVRNALGAFAMARLLGVEAGVAAAALATFRGVARRQEVVGEFGGVLLLDDFAHHPTAVRGAIEAVHARFPGRPLWALFEPRSNTSRRRVFQAEFADALATAERIVVGAVFAKQTDVVRPEEMFSPEELVAQVRERGRPAWTLPDAAAIAHLVAERAQPGDVVLMMSNGPFGGLRDLLAEALRQRSAPSGASVC